MLLSLLTLLIWVLAVAFAFAKVEVQIEGSNGWAANLPTWRIEKHPLLDLLWGGRPLTGYHVWAFTFMAFVFHAPLVFAGTFSAILETRILGALALFWIAEDFLWFVINPAYGLRKFRKGEIAWHKFWIGPVPADYVTFLLGAALLIGFSYRHA